MTRAGMPRPWDRAAGQSTWTLEECRREVEKREREAAELDERRSVLVKELREWRRRFETADVVAKGLCRQCKTTRISKDSVSRCERCLKVARDCEAKRYAEGKR